MDQSQVRYVAFSTEEDALAMIERLDAEEAWEDLVAEIEADEDSTAYSGDETWWTQNYVTEIFGEDIAATVFDTPAGSYTAPLAGSSGRSYVIEIIEREDAELTGAMLGFEQDNYFQEWLSAQRELIEFAEDWQDKVPTDP
jgi:hypothetical protein